MFSNHAQVGRTRVSKVREGNRNKKTHVQYKKDNKTCLDKLFLLQNELFKEGLSLNEYEDYVQDKINNDKYYYKHISQADVAKLNKRYRLLIQKENNNINKRGDEVKYSRDKKKKYRAKKHNLVMEKKRELINLLFKEMNKSKSIGLGRNPQLLSDDPEKWNDTKLLLFTGGRYLEGSDKGWTNIYNKIESMNTANMFDLANHSDLKKFVLNN